MPNSANPLRSRVDLRDAAQLKTAMEVGIAWREIRRGSMGAKVRDHLHGAGDGALESGQVDTLDLLNERDAWRMSDLAEAMRVDPSSATRAVERLVKAGLATRRASVDDGRVVMVTATQAGRAQYDVLMRRRALLLARVLERFDPDERQQLATTLTRFIDALDDVSSSWDDTVPW